ncbi:tRNA lysidine(34) synthetase TilS [Bifidobacterium sp. 82T24]|uniref:tRNA lysidine(34) synthetase TilS n=1 Tax=Bifidobacterium pluvialisilvae TaxID=2834436 RepID=UPI001C59766D|nr:tRNA lysidine(34) synthetase TilS [Bifidobacterium pluvialisilvae]MBW3088408.1 tRNA lysidine(34) synthetase TilS [Bifidobacterium pluvialisilvae]
MTYTPTLRQAIGEVRRNLESIGVTRQSPRLREHGDHTPEPDAPLVLVACSGGRDSLALASVAATVCGTLGVRCGAVIVDHALIAGSANVAAEAAERCRGFGMEPVVVRRVVVRPTGAGTEADARSVRYQALIDAAKAHGAATVLLAHTRDDQAETVLLGLLRTVGLDALAGMPASITRDGVLFSRPFLALTRAQTTEICESRGITWWDDPTNGDLADEGGLSTDLPLRSRIRQALLPYLVHLTDADTVGHLARSAQFAQRDKDYLDSQADRLYRRSVTFNDDDGKTRDAGRSGHWLARIDARELAGQHPAMRSRVIARTLAACGAGTSSRHVDAIDALVADWHGQGAVRLSSSHSAFRQGHVILVCHDRVHENR